MITDCSYPSDAIEAAAALALHASAKDGPILCSHKVSEACQGLRYQTDLAFDLRLVDIMGPKGSKKAYIPGTKKIIAKTAPLAMHRLHGRDLALQQLLHQLTRPHLSQHSINCMKVVGNAGMGKTSLIERAVVILEDCSIPQESESALGRLKTLWLRVGRSDAAPLSMCQKIVAWLLQLEGVRESDSFSCCLAACLHGFCIRRHDFNAMQ
eukprot:scaffold580656_cov52-Prasinocladus_malaysianus.AAC.1